MSYKIFIVEDDPWYGQLLTHHLGLNPDFDITLFEKGKEMLSKLYQKPDLICMDFGLQDMKGETLLKEIQKRNNTIPVVVISGQEEISVAVNLLKLGARDYIIKDAHAKDLLWRSVINIRENQNLRDEVDALKEQLSSKYSFEKNIIGNSTAIKKTFKLLEKAIRTNINVSITGETGSGKEVFAKAIHYNSDRRKKPFIAINMAAIPKDLAESELFGHEKGAFTGADSMKKGKFEDASGGTIFLDEIGEMDVNLQVKLLRVLQEREVVRVGGNKAIPFDVRLISATHKNLAEEVKKGNFREDLYFRIIGLPIELPPLRERENDLFLLAKHFIAEASKENGIKAPALSSGAREKLASYPFPGNVRELKAVLELAVVMCDGDEILPDDITFYNALSSDMLISGTKTLREHTNDIIQYYLSKNDDNVVKTAEILDIGKSTIYNLLKSGEITTK
ncbi:MAG: sigma-54-dependent Fis family transcriptional regulator [Balneolaceae bacterium]|nr:MAG: sigma-54-dependent Fis family transcriptional regulator [Balneolaceae bacterium]